MLAAMQGFALWAQYGVPAFLFLITLVVFFHELGHFAVARLFGVRVETFSIGFGRELVGWTDRKGTRWKISLIPLGGYVKFLGDLDAAGKPDRVAVSRLSAAERAVAFPFKPLYQRALIVAAGPVANFILALVILTGVFMFVGRIVIPAQVGGVVPGSAAAAAGLHPGDRFISVDGENVTTFEELEQIVSMSAGRDLPIVLDRHGSTIYLHATPRATQITDRFKNSYKIGRLGITSPKVTGPVRYGPIGAVGAAVDEIRVILTSTFRSRHMLISGDTSQLSGPIGIAKLSGQVASVSLIALINLAALISVSIGLVNLFPIPLLDGGHLLYYGCEAVLGRPLGERAQDVGFRLGLALVLGLMLLATWTDLARLNLF